MDRMEEMQKIERNLSKLEGSLEEMRKRLATLKEELHVEPFTYDDLTETVRREQRNKSPSKIRMDFYPVMKDVHRMLKIESGNAFAEDPFSTKSKLAANQLGKYEEKSYQVIAFRFPKIVDIAVRKLEGRECFGIERLTAEEMVTFNKIKEAFAELAQNVIPLEEVDE